MQWKFGNPNRKSRLVMIGALQGARKSGSQPMNVGWSVITRNTLNILTPEQPEHKHNYHEHIAKSQEFPYQVSMFIHFQI